MNVRIRRFMAFWKEHGSARALKLVRSKLGDLVRGRPVFNSISTDGLRTPAQTLHESVHAAVSRRFSASRPLSVFLVPKRTPARVSLVTDSIGASSLFGGVGTALIFAALLANRSGLSLRIVTRTETPSPDNARKVLEAYGIRLTHEIQFAFSSSHEVPSARAVAIDVQPDELFLTTSWWTTAATLRSVPASSVIYLLQEDERMFYPFGEDRLRCEEVLRRTDIRFVINTRLLYDHLSATGMGQLSSRGLWFEPSFPTTLFHPRPRERGAKKRFFYYARPNNPRNLFHIGLEVIDRAVNQGVLDLDRWEIYLVGKDIPNVSVGDGYFPHRLEGLDWKGYADLVGTIDLGLSLMYTPHPSYPPFDLAASGAVVVTNKFENKQDLFAYSKNIICAELTTSALVDAIQQAIALVDDSTMRSANDAAAGLGRDWASSFEPVLQSLLVPR